MFISFIFTDKHISRSTTDMLDEEILVMISHFEVEVSVADAYLAIKSNGL